MHVNRLETKNYTKHCCLDIFLHVWLHRDKKKLYELNI